MNNSLRLYSISSAAKLMGICRDSVRTFLSKGDLGYIEVGRRKKIPHEELVRFQKEQIQKKRKPDRSEMNSAQISDYLKKSKKKGANSFDSKQILNDILT